MAQPSLDPAAAPHGRQPAVTLVAVAHTAQHPVLRLHQTILGAAAGLKIRVLPVHIPADASTAARKTAAFTAKARATLALGDPAAFPGDDADLLIFMDAFDVLSAPRSAAAIVARFHAILRRWRRGMLALGELQPYGPAGPGGPGSAGKAGIPGKAGKAGNTSDAAIFAHGPVFASGEFNCWPGRSRWNREGQAAVARRRLAAMQEAWCAEAAAATGQEPPPPQHHGINLNSGFLFGTHGAFRAVRRLVLARGWQPPYCFDYMTHRQLLARHDFDDQFYWQAIMHAAPALVDLDYFADMEVTIQNMVPFQAGDSALRLRVLPASAAVPTGRAASAPAPAPAPATHGDVLPVLLARLQLEVRFRGQTFQPLFVHFPGKYGQYSIARFMGKYLAGLQRLRKTKRLTPTALHDIEAHMASLAPPFRGIMETYAIPRGMASRSVRALIGEDVGAPTILVVLRILALAGGILLLLAAGIWYVRRRRGRMEHRPMQTATAAAGRPVVGEDG